MEKRKASRLNVVWRGAIKVGEAKIVAAKVINLSESGIMFECMMPVELQKEYEFMMEVPGIHQAADAHRVRCRVKILHTILSEGIYRIGVKFAELSDLHRDLIAAQVSILRKA
jgi:c-di-GMP-binding flagellar brake protein YcgR